MNNKYYLYITLLSVLGLHTEVQAQNNPRAVPRLVVSITIDQLSTDLLETFSPFYGQDGFQRLIKQGMVFDNACYPMAHIDRASAISSVMTGTTPFYHSIVAHRWLDRNTLQPQNSTATTNQPSPAALLTSTLGDEMKIASKGKAKVFAIAPFEEAAILAAGHAADGAVWMSPQNGIWQCAAYYSGSPLYWLHSFNKQKRHQQNQTSPLVNADVTELALNCVNEQSMGLDDIPDLLCLTYYAGTFGNQPASQEKMKDLYVRLDRAMGVLISQLESLFGREQLLFMVTSTGYQAPEPVDYATYRIPTGNFYINRASNLLNLYFGALWGQGNYVEACYGNQLFLNRKLLESRRITLSEAEQKAQEFVAQMSGVANVYTGTQLATNASTSLLPIRNSYNTAHCGDIMVEVAPGWHLCNEQTGDDWVNYPQTVVFPIIFYGANTKPERVTVPVTACQIAPTLARAIRIRAPNAAKAAPLFCHE